MSKAPSMPMYWDAYLADTTHLTTEEHGAYLLLLAAMWRRNGVLPDNDRDNARILGLTPSKWRKIKARLSETVSGFKADGNTVTQEKLQKTWKNTQEKINKNRENGAKGGRPKSSKNKDIAKANGSVSLNPNKSIPEPEPYIKETPNGVSKKRRGSRLSDDWFLPRAWGDWAQAEGFSADTIRSEADKFKDYWISTPGQKGVKLDWQATWRNWMRNSDGKRTHKPAGHAATDSFLAGWGLDGSQDAGGSASDSPSMRDVTPPGSDRMAAGQDWNTPGAILRFPTSAGNGPGDF